MKTSKKIILNWCPPVCPNMPSPAHSIIQAFLQANGYSVEIVYWNLLFYKLQTEFLWNDSRLIQENTVMTLFYNYLAFESNDNSAIASIKMLLQSLNPKHSLDMDNYYEIHMLKYYNLTKCKFQEIIGKLNTENVLYYGFQLKMDQWIFASIIASLLKIQNRSNIIVVGGINTKDEVIAFLDNFPNFDVGMWGEGEYPLLQLTELIETWRNSNKKNATHLDSIPNIAYRNGNKIVVSSKVNSLFFDISSKDIFPDFSDYFRELKESKYYGQTYLPIEKSRGCHWNKCKFCFLNVGYKYRCKTLDKLKEEIEYMIEKWGVADFEFLDNDLIGNDIEQFNKMLKLFGEIKKKFEPFKIVVAEIITKGLNSDTIKKMSDVGFQSVQIGYESPSNHLLRKIFKKNSFASNLLFIKFALEYNIKIGIVNVIQNLPEENEADIIESADNLSFLRFYLNPNKLRHHLIPLYVKACSKYYKQIKNELSTLWEPCLIINFLPKNFIKSNHIPQIFDHNKISRNYLWQQFQKIENYYLMTNFRYEIIKKENGVVIKEFANTQNIQSYIFTYDSLELFVLEESNNEVVSISELYTKYIRRYNNATEDMIRDTVDRLHMRKLIYRNDDYSEILTIINIKKSDAK